ncbi:MAG: Unknown protein [uncultured Thiotrichaceae bacterium]|uniref:Uncharacterized protein n=1 Tax=uncultured Thiotrichaceae bacterium TaxID=298394 RepID=A0A6S6UDV4_9GAMM|nr:MAG: Unknown protein [uncultured Thiotrichaceae bacterium]
MNKAIYTTLSMLAISGLTACSQQTIIPEATEAPPKKATNYAHTQSVQHNNVTQEIPKALPLLQPKAVYMPQQQAYQARPSYMPNQSRHELRQIGQKIFVNEAGGDRSKLVHWNYGENFGAMGIGHWTWYPAGKTRYRYGNTFPGLLSFMETKGVQLPQWLKVAKVRGAPWANRSQLMRAKNTHQVRELEQLLHNTKDIQAEYIIQRAKRAMPRLVKTSPGPLRSRVSQNLHAVSNSPGGWYALVDYVNFKGEGLNRRGGYRGQNWGLLQVLENMQPAPAGQPALNNFATSAMQVLQRRVRNSPPSRGESRWLTGWSNRINTYRYPI